MTDDLAPNLSHDGTEPDDLEPLQADEVGGPTLTLGQAVRTTGVARSTLQRRLATGAVPGATRTAAGGWSIPVAGLIRAGLTPAVTPPPLPPGPDGGPDPVTDEVAELRAELERTRAERDQADALRVQAEALAAERAAHVADLRAALETLSRALPPAPPVTTDAAAPSVILEPTPAPRRRWWQRA